MGPGQSYVVAPTASNKMPDYGADFPDPATGYANPNGVVMWYHDNSGPHDFGNSVPAVLTEMTFRDPKQPFFAPDMPPSEVNTIDNYDVSYVDNLAFPASMEGTNVPLAALATSPPTSGNYTWLGSDMSTEQMQELIGDFTTNNLNINTQGAAPGINGLGTYFGGLGYDQYYEPSNNSPNGAITSINNGGATVPVTITVPNTGGLVSGDTVTISGVTGQTNLNGNWTINNLTLNTFQLVGSTGDPMNPASGGTFAVPNTGINIKKLPAGFQVIADSANNNVASPFNSNQYALTSGGTKDLGLTNSTGAATAGSTDITGVNFAAASQLTPGMSWSAVNAPNGKPFFPAGTTIASIELGAGPGNTATLHMSAPALSGGSPGFPNGPGGNWTFSGSQFTSAMGSIAAGSLNVITGIDPAVGIYLRPGMLVTGTGIQPPTGSIGQTFIQSISPDFTKVTLSQNGIASPSKSYTFLGSGSSYVVQKLVDVWYAWADYYVRNASTPNSASVTASVYGPNNPAVTPAGTNYADPRRDPNALLLTGLTTALTSTLQIGDVVTGPGLTPNPTGTPGTPGYDPSLNYTITKIYDTSVELSLPTTGAFTNGSYNFTAPQYVVRSSDAPAAPGTAGTVPYTLDFAAAQKQSAMLFASQVYDVMQSFSLLVDPNTVVSRSARLIQYSIGGNVGSFVANDDLFAGITGRRTSLPLNRTNLELRDEIKSILRGVYDFNKVPDQSQWYPAPATPTVGATLDTGSGALPISFGIQNLNPYVWFVHDVLHNSSYGFSLDDDVANTTANSSSIQIAFGGNAYTAPITQTPAPPATLKNLESFTPGAPFGSESPFGTSTGFIDVTSSYAISNAAANPPQVTISGLSDIVVAALVASTSPTDPPGALIFSDVPGLLPAGLRVANVHVANHLPGDDVSWVSFFRPSGFTVPTDQAQHTFTFSSFTTSLPTDITPSVSQAVPGTVITITGKGFTGVYGVSFNGIPGTIIGTPTDTAVQVMVPKFTPNVTLSNGNTTTHPGPIGKIALRNTSGSGYSSANFTIGSLGAVPSSFLAVGNFGGSVRIVNSSTGAVISTIRPLDKGSVHFTGLVEVALGDFNGDGVPDLVVSAANSEGSFGLAPSKAGKVFVYDGASLLAGTVPNTPFRSFTPFATTDGPGGTNGAYINGVDIAVGDVNGDGVPDLIAGTRGMSGTLGKAEYGRLVVIDGTSPAGSNNIIGGIHTPFGAGYQKSVVVAAGNVDGTGGDEIAVTRGGPVADPDAQKIKVKVLQLQSGVLTELHLAADGGTALAAFGSLSGPANAINRNGRVAFVDVNGDGKDELVFSALDPLTNPNNERVRVAVYSINPTASAGAATIVSTGADAGTYLTGKAVVDHAITHVATAGTSQNLALITESVSPGIVYLDPLTGAVRSSVFSLSILHGGVTIDSV